MLDSRSLQLAIENGIISEDEIRLQVEMYERKKYLAMHTHKIWQGSNGFWYTYVPDASMPKKRRKIKKKNKDDIEKAIVCIYHEAEQSIYFADVFSMWAEERLKYGYIKKQTYDRYGQDFYRFFIIANPQIAKTPFKKITEAELEKFIMNSIAEQNLTAKGWAKLRTLIIGTFTKGNKEGLTYIKIRDFIHNLDIPKKMFKERIFESETQVFRTDEVELIIQYLIDANKTEKYPARKLVNLGILLTFKTGLRAGELSTLKWSDCNLETQILKLRRTEIHFKNDEGIMKRGEANCTKGRIGFRDVLIPTEACDIIREIRKINPNNDYLFYNELAHTTINATSFTRKLKRICSYLNITERSLHKARKTYATVLLNHNVGDEFIIRQMGHTDISTTKKYYWFNNNTVEQSLDLLEEALK